MSLRLAAVAAMLVTTFAVAQVVARDRGVAAAQPDLGSIPMTMASWVGTPGAGLTSETAAVIAADQYIHRFYTSNAGRIEMDVAYYARPRVGANMHSPLNCLPGNGWAVTDSRALDITANGSTWTIRRLVAQRGRDSCAIAYWLQSRDRIVSNELSSRFYVLADAVRRRPTDASLVRVMMPASQMSDPGMLGAFAARLIPEIARRLD